MSEAKQMMIPEWPAGLADIDMARVRFVLEFESSCAVEPADFLGLGRALKQFGRQSVNPANDFEREQWERLFQPLVSTDPVARRKHQKPAPAYVMTMPVTGKTFLEAGDHLLCEVLFIGTGIPLIHVFLRSLSHLGRLGLVAGEGRFEVAEVRARGADDAETRIWSQGEPADALACPVLPLPWLFRETSLGTALPLRFTTPARLMVDGRPLRKPKFRQVFPFMLRRVTSMFNAHSGFEPVLDVPGLLESARQVKEVDSQLSWNDWREIDRTGLAIGGFIGSMTLAGPELEELYWVLAAASLLGIGKGASCGAGQVELGE